jgi:hypothetical protein
MWHDDYPHRPQPLRRRLKTGVHFRERKFRRGGSGGLPTLLVGPSCEVPLQWKMAHAACRRRTGPALPAQSEERRREEGFEPPLRLPVKRITDALP